VSAPGFYRAIKKRRFYDPEQVASWFTLVSRDRVSEIAVAMERYISTNLPTAIRSKSTLGDYRTSPYVLMAAAGALRLEDLRDLSKFLVDIKLYMGLETSFGKSIEKVVMGHYPANARPKERWQSPAEKEVEFGLLQGLTSEEKSARRVDSVWREIDSSCVRQKRRHLMSIKSGVATINDTQVGGMFTAIRDNHLKWLDSSRKMFDVDGIDVVVGLTYGTDWATNNKENQILNKLLTAGFHEQDRASSPGVLSNVDGSVRVYRAVGIDYWAYAARPDDPKSGEFAFLEVLLGLARALRLAHEKADIGSALNERLDLLGQAFQSLRFPQGDELPSWISVDLGLTELTWLAAALSAFFDEPRS
jgi:hypothetical protein